MVCSNMLLSLDFIQDSSATQRDDHACGPGKALNRLLGSTHSSNRDNDAYGQDNRYVLPLKCLGAEAILQGFRVHPPDDELVVQSIRAVGNKTAEATYSWESAPGKLAGRLHVVALRGLISAIRIEVFS